jgi:hypothetical protein
MLDHHCFRNVLRRRTHQGTLREWYTARARAPLIVSSWTFALPGASIRRTAIGAAIGLVFVAFFLGRLILPP